MSRGVIDISMCSKPCSEGDPLRPPCCACIAYDWPAYLLDLHHIRIECSRIICVVLALHLIVNKCAVPQSLLSLGTT
jgi:hypothetical protein